MRWLWCLMDHVWCTEKSTYWIKRQSTLQNFFGALNFNLQWISHYETSYREKGTSEENWIYWGPCFKLILTLGIWSLLLPVASLHVSLANIYKQQDRWSLCMVSLGSSSSGIYLSLNELFFPTMKKTVFPHEYEPRKCFVRIWHSFYSQNLLLCCLSPADTYWNTNLWHHHADWNPHLNTLLNLSTRLKPNTYLRT